MSLKGTSLKKNIAAKAIVAIMVLSRSASVWAEEPDMVSTSPRPSAGCQQPSDVGGIELMSVRDGEGIERTVELHRPPRQAGPLSLVVALHGAGGHALDAVRYGLEDVPGAAEAAFFAYPEGREFQSYGRGWNDSCSGYDMAFFDKTIQSIKSRYCIDENRVFVAGFSWGCDFATALACCRGDQIRGIAAAACSDEFKNPADPATYLNGSCPVTSKAAIRFTHQEKSDSAYPAPYFATTSRLFQAFNACPAKAPKSDGPHCVAYQGCRQDLVECAFKGIGHAPARTGRSTLGHSSPDCAERTPLDAIGQNAASVADALY